MAAIKKKRMLKTMKVSTLMSFYILWFMMNNAWNSSLVNWCKTELSNNLYSVQNLYSKESKNNLWLLVIAVNATLKELMHCKEIFIVK